MMGKHPALLGLEDFLELQTLLGEGPTTCFTVDWQNLNTLACRKVRVSLSVTIQVSKLATVHDRSLENATAQ